jgi:integrase
MSVRRVKRREPTTGATWEHWIVDIVFEHADGRLERVRKVPPVQTRRGAEEYERQLRAELLSPSSIAKEVPTFRKFVEEHWWPTYPHAAGNRASTIKEKDSHLRLYLYPLLGHVSLDRIKGEVVAKLFASLRRHGLGEKSVKNVRATLRRILASAVEWGVLEAVPHLPRVKVPESKFDFFTPEDSRVLVATARNPEERALFLFALHTGARAGEQRAVEWGDIDWRNKSVRFRRAIVDGKVGPTKSGKERSVPLTPTLEAALKAIRHLRGPLVFCNPDGSALTLWQLHDRFQYVSRRAGLRQIRWHDLRHTFASQLVAAGVPLLQVQAWLGHATINMTMRYAHLAPNAGTELIRLLDQGNLTATEDAVFTKQHVSR